MWSHLCHCHLCRCHLPSQTCVNVVDLPRGATHLSQHHLPAPHWPVVGRHQWHAEGDLPHPPTWPQPNLTPSLPRHQRGAAPVFAPTGECPITLCVTNGWPWFVDLFERVRCVVVVVVVDRMVQENVHVYRFCVSKMAKCFENINFVLNNWME